MTNSSNLDSRPLGASGLAVSAFGLGVMTFGGQTPEEDAVRQLDMAYAAGITLFDTAENYPTPTGPETQGRSEEVLGRWIADRGLRDRVVIATKVAGPGNAAGDMRHIRGEHRRLDRANIRAACEASLRRLGTDHIDLYQIHWADRAISTLGRSRFSALPVDPAEVPIAETLAALAELVTEGKVRAIGVCNESPWGAMTWLAAAHAAGHPRLASIQNGYSLLDRSYELGLAEIGMRERIGLIGYSPLARGLLSDKYAGVSGTDTPLLARFTPGKRAAVRAYAELARAHGLTPAQLALAFARQQPFMASVLMAASHAGQLAENLTAIAIVLGADVIKAVNAIHDGQPNPR